MCVSGSCVDIVFIADSQLQTCGSLGCVIYQHHWNRFFSAMSVFVTQQTCYLSVSKLVQVVLILYLSARLINHCIFNIAEQFQSGWNNRTYFFGKVI
jgi:hypothetical protein